jgi:hypothetical protein
VQCKRIGVNATPRVVERAWSTPAGAIHRAATVRWRATAPTPGVATARTTGRGRNTTPALAVQPPGYSTYWQVKTPRPRRSVTRYFCQPGFSPSPLASSVIRNTSKITAVDQPNNSTPFIAVIGPSRCQRTTGVTSP